jgi:hypothetical protein
MRWFLLARMRWFLLARMAGFYLRLMALVFIYNDNESTEIRKAYIDND